MPKSNPRNTPITWARFDKLTDSRLSVGTLCCPYDDSPIVARVVWRHPRDGAGRLWCVLHVYGAPPFAAHADGFGYDKRGAGFALALLKFLDWRGADRNPPVDDLTRIPWLTIDRDALRDAATGAGMGTVEKALRDVGLGFQSIL